ncbi:MAG: hypothetical protein ACPL7B_14080, partial [Candidatus Poribacteria bacterium]
MKSEGVCNFCKKTFSGKGMVKHLEACSERKKALENEKGKGKVFLIKASSDPYWVFFEVNATAKLKTVDNFLRDLWLECCGHLSCFIIDDEEYMSDPWDDQEGMDAKLNKVIKETERRRTAQ